MLNNLEKFKELAIDSNDGKFTISIDETEYSDIGISLSLPSSISQDLGSTASNIYGNNIHGQRFIMEKVNVIESVTLNLRKVGTPDEDYTVSIYETSGDFPVGEPLATVTKRTSELSTSFEDVEVDIKEQLIPLKGYAIVVECENGTSSNYIAWATNTSDVYDAGVSFYSNNGGDSWVSEMTRDKRFSISYIEVVNTYQEIASLIETELRSKTGKNEQVIFNTDHFEIIGDNPSQLAHILKLQPPTTGTDISGEGYLDLGTNATEIKGQGDDYKLVRLNNDGLVPDYTIPYTNSFPFANVVYEDNAEQQTNSTSYAKVKEIEFKSLDGIINVSFDLKNNNNSYIGYGRIYINGTAVGTERSRQSTSYETFSEDIKIKNGDLIQIYCKTSNTSSGREAVVANMKISFGLIPVKLN